MMRIGITLLSFLLVAVLLIGCTQQQSAPGPSPTPANNTPGNNTPTTPEGNPPVTPNNTPTTPENNPPINTAPPTPGTVTMDQIYQLGSVHSYEYVVVSTSGGQTTTMDFKNTVTSDTVNGVAAWLQQTDMVVQGASVTSKMWVDKVTYECLKVTSVVTYGGQTMEQPSQCPTEGPNSASRTGTATPTMTFLGSESVTVPAGTYTANEYSLENVTYWSASGVPVPIKITYGDGSMSMELASYT